MEQRNKLEQKLIMNDLDKEFIYELQYRLFLLVISNPALAFNSRFHYYKILRDMGSLEELNSELKEKLFHRLQEIDRMSQDIDTRISTIMGALFIAIHAKCVLYFQSENFIKIAYALDRAHFYLDEIENYDNLPMNTGVNKCLLKTNNTGENYYASGKKW